MTEIEKKPQEQHLCHICGEPAVVIENYCAHYKDKKEPQMLYLCYKHHDQNQSTKTIKEMRDS